MIQCKNPSCETMTEDISGVCSQKCEYEFKDKQPPQCDECSETNNVRYEQNNETTLCRKCFDDFFYEYNEKGRDKLWSDCIIPTKRMWDMVKDFPPTKQSPHKNHNRSRNCK